MYVPLLGLANCTYKFGFASKLNIVTITKFGVKLEFDAKFYFGFKFNAEFGTKSIIVFHT